MTEALAKLLDGRPGHFQLESGFHSDLWFDLDSLLEKRAQLEPFVTELSHRLARHRPTAVCGPETGGARLAEMIAHHLGVPWFCTERLCPENAHGFYPVQ